MPWHVEFGNAGCGADEWAVVKDDDGAIEGCHPSRADAEEQVTALYANSPEAVAVTGEPPTVASATALTAAADVKTGAMVAFVPTSRDAMRVVIPEGEDLAQLHVTALYLGDAASFAPEQRAAIVDRVRQFAGTVGPITAMAFGIAEFNPGGDDPCLTLLLSGAGLAQAEAGLCADAELMGMASQEQHAPWIPHITLIYAPEPYMYEADAAAVLGPVTLDRVRVAFAGENIDIPLSGPAPTVADLEPVEPVIRPEIVEEAAEQATMEGVALDLDEALTAAGWTITLADLPPEEFFDEPDPSELPPLGSLSIGADGRVVGLIAPRGVVHRAFRSGRNPVMVPTGQDYTEFNNKPVLTASANGEVVQRFAGSLTFDCGHLAAEDPSRAAGTGSAKDHYDNSCSIAARVVAGEHSMTGQPYIVGSLLSGLTASTLERMMGCVVSGDWQQGKFNAALMVPVEGFPSAVPDGARLVVGDGRAMVSSAVARMTDTGSVVDDFDAALSKIGLDPGAQLDRLVASIGE